MKIITIGKIPTIYDFDIEEIYEKVCISCRTKFECTESETTHMENVHAIGIDDVYLIDCPICGKTNIAFVNKRCDLTTLFKSKRGFDYENWEKEL